jgi:hypothetical protein
VTLVPDSATPIAGWRVWTVIDRGRGPELLSPVRPVPWVHRAPTTATCAAGCRACPSAECSCGLYATDVLAPLALACRRGATVLGCTALWGRVVEHTDGWRAEHGYPLVLIVMSGILVDPVDPVARIRRLRRPVSELDDRPEGLGSVEGLSEELSRLYGVPAHPAPSLRSDRLRGWIRAGRRAADAVRSEAADGLARRRSGDPAAHDRLTGCVRDLVGSA